MVAALIVITLAMAAVVVKQVWDRFGQGSA